MFVKHTPLRLDPDPFRVILQYLDLKKEYRVKNLPNTVNSLSEIEGDDILNKVVAEFEGRHPYFEIPLGGFESGHSCFRKALNQLCNKKN